LLFGGLQATDASFDAGVATTLPGAEGTVADVGVTAFDAADAGPDPFPLDAVTVNV
jgi:hypothetical protein